MSADRAIEDPEQALAVARRYLEVRSYARAEETLRAALSFAPQHPGLLTELARTQIQLDDPHAGAQTAYAALTQAPQSAYAMRVYAIALGALHRPYEGVQVAWRAVGADPQDHANHLVYAALLHQAGRSEYALTVVGEAVRLAPDDADGHVLRGEILRKLGRQRESTLAYQEALRIEPESSDAIHNIAVNRTDGGRWASAVEGFMAAARMDPRLGALARSNIAVAVRDPLRRVTGLALLVMLFASSAAAQQDDGRAVIGLRIGVACGVVVLVALMLWIGRRLPLRVWRLALRTRRYFVVRLAVVAVCLVFAVLAAAGFFVGGLTQAMPYLLLGVIGVIVVGWFVGG